MPAVPETGRDSVGDGSEIQSIDNDANLSRIARYKWTTANPGVAYANIDWSCAPDDGTAVVGSYQPNDWGLYDMHGNVAEWCLDFIASDISHLNGAVNANGTQTVPKDGESAATGGARVVRGDWWDYPAHRCRSGRRGSEWPNCRRGNDMSETVGLRLCCPASLR